MTACVPTANPLAPQPSSPTPSSHTHTMPIVMLGLRYDTMRLGGSGAASSSSPEAGSGGSSSLGCCSWSLSLPLPSRLTPLSFLRSGRYLTRG
jgi:hypothetical protein